MIKELIQQLTEEDRLVLMLAFNNEEPYSININGYTLCVHTPEDDDTVETCGDWSLKQ
jgi:hypothetical protein